ncbi:MAG: response regulator [Evtepia gabavorous]
MLYRTVIIEDDSVITHLNRRYVEMDNRFCVVQTFSAAHPALFWLRSNPVDLIILDVYMPQMSGLDLLRALRAEGVDADVIMVTSADDATTIEAFMRLGVTDYLIKPFGYERFQLALKTFCQRRNAIHSGKFTQTKLVPPCSISPPREPAAPLPCPRAASQTLSLVKATSVTPPRRDIPVMTLPAMSGCPLSPCGAI